MIQRHLPRGQRILSPCSTVFEKNLSVGGPGAGLSHSLCKRGGGGALLLLLHSSGDLDRDGFHAPGPALSLIHISEPTRRTPISYAVFCLQKKKKTNTT